MILRSKDTHKDQSYFLWQIKKEQLDKILFPVGEFENKAQVREYAKENDLITASKPDSQGLCFIGQTPLRQMLLQTLGEKVGDIISKTGKVLGQHSGAYLYTIGQRQGLGLSGGPWYVCNIDVETNIVTVSTNLANLEGIGLIAKNPNWHRDLPNNLQCQCQIRYQQKPLNCTVTLLPDNQLQVLFDQPAQAIAKGQSIVFYDNDHLLGGAIIDQPINYPNIL